MSGSENFCGLWYRVSNGFQVILARDDVGCDGYGEDGGEAEGDADDGDDAALLLLDDGDQGRVLRHGAPPLLGGHVHNVTAASGELMLEKVGHWRVDLATLLRCQMEISFINAVDSSNQSCE